MAVPNISEIVTTTIQSRSKKLADNVMNNNALLFQLQKKNRVKPVSGGDVILQELYFQENSSFKRYSGYEQLDISPSEVISSASFNYKQAAVAVSISGLEEIQNAGKEQMIDLLESRIENAETTLSNNIATDCYSDGTANGSKQIGGLQHLIADSPATGTVGGIDRATYSFYRNISYDATTDGGGAATASNIVGYMNAVYTQLCRGKDKPDLIVADNNYWTFYLEHVQNIQRVGSQDMADAGFPNLGYFDAPVVLDGGIGGGSPTNHMYFINSKYIHWRPHRQRNFVPLSPDRFATNQDAMVRLIGWAGNMTLSGGKFQGVLKD